MASSGVDLTVRILEDAARHGFLDANLVGNPTLAPQGFAGKVGSGLEFASNRIRRAPFCHPFLVFLEYRFCDVFPPAGSLPSRGIWGAGLLPRAKRSGRGL
jgi:hypothetical protein